MVDLEQKARDEIDRLEKKKADLDREIAQWQDWIERYQQLAASPGDACSPETSEPHSPPHKVRDRQRVLAVRSPTPTQVIREKARAAILSRGKPIPLRELTSILETDGIHIGGGNPAANLSAKLAQGDGFVSIRNEGWTLQELLDSSGNENGEATASPETADVVSTKDASDTLEGGIG